MSITINGSGTITGLVAGGLPDATITSAELAANAVDAQTLTLLNASGSAPVYACRAWVNFNGTGTVAIRGSGNVSSITDNGVGDYSVNFITAMPDTNFSATPSSGHGTASFSAGYVTQVGLYAVSSIRLSSYISATGAAADNSFMNVNIFR